MCAYVRVYVCLCVRVCVRVVCALSCVCVKTQQFNAIRKLYARITDTHTHSIHIHTGTHTYSIHTGTRTNTGTQVHMATTNTYTQTNTFTRTNTYTQVHSTGTNTYTQTNTYIEHICSYTQIGSCTRISSLYTRGTVYRNKQHTHKRTRTRTKFVHIGTSYRNKHLSQTEHVYKNNSLYTQLLADTYKNKLHTHRYSDLYNFIYWEHKSHKVWTRTRTNTFCTNSDTYIEQIAYTHWIHIQDTINYIIYTNEHVQEQTHIAQTNTYKLHI